MGCFLPWFSLPRPQVDPRIHMALNCGAKSCRMLRCLSLPQIQKYAIETRESHRITRVRRMTWFFGSQNLFWDSESQWLNMFSPTDPHFSPDFLIQMMKVRKDPKIGILHRNLGRLWWLVTGIYPEIHRSKEFEPTKVVRGFNLQEFGNKIGIWPTMNRSKLPVNCCSNLPMSHTTSTFWQTEGKLPFK